MEKDPPSPPTKKSKSTTEIISVIPILNDSLLQTDIPVRKVFTAILKSKKDANNLLKSLPPLPSELEHLKRIRNNGTSLEIIIGKDLLEPEHPTQPLFESVQESQVPKCKPLSTIQFKRSNEFWPCNFHPDKEIEKLLSENCGFGEIDLNIISNNMKIVIDKFNSISHQCCAIYDPSDSELVCIATSSAKLLGHSVMNCLDILGETQKDFERRDHSEVRNWGEITCKRNVRNKHTDYLCTGLDIYMSHEPCVMCAMALLHSRARRIFFQNNLKNGGLMSTLKLHCLEGINHRFEVFKVQNCQDLF